MSSERYADSVNPPQSTAGWQPPSQHTHAATVTAKLSPIEVRVHALNAAMSLTVARLNRGVVQDCGPVDVLDVADTFESWLTEPEPAVRDGE